ncbi:MAG: hypothetical protein FJW32_03415 [Acidobacteria bacterium]|nr:hypothetical protein [Acidobacteriota bacterium]
MDEREQMRRWVQNWKELGPILEEMKQHEIREEDNVAGLRQLARAFDYATRREPPCQDSGLVEMQRLLAKMPR